MLQFAHVLTFLFLQESAAAKVYMIQSRILITQSSVIVSVAYNTVLSLAFIAYTEKYLSYSKPWLVRFSGWTH